MNLQEKRKGSLPQSFLYLLASHGFGAVLSFGIMSLLGRQLGADGLGIYSSVLAWVFVLMLMSELGLGTLTIRHLSQHPEETRAFVRLSLLIRLVMGTISSLLFVGIIAVLTPRNAQSWLIALPMLFILPTYSTFSAVFRTFERMQWVSLLNLGMLFTQIALLAHLLNTNTLSLANALIANTLTSLGQLAVAGVLYFIHIQRVAPLTPTLSLKALLESAFPFALASFLGAIQARLAIILLERFASPYDVGYFVVALRYMDVVRLLPMAYYDALFPRLSSQQTIPERQRIFWGAMRLLTVYGVAMTALIIAFAPSLVALVLGTPQTVASNILIIYALGILPLCWRGVLSLFYYAMGYEAVANRITATIIGVFLLSVLGFGIGAKVETVAWVLVWGDALACVFLWMNRPYPLRAGAE